MSEVRFFEDRWSWVDRPDLGGGQCKSHTIAYIPADTPEEFYGYVWDNHAKWGANDGYSIKLLPAESAPPEAAVVVQVDPAHFQQWLETQED